MILLIVLFPIILIIASKLCFLRNISWKWTPCLLSLCAAVLVILIWFLWGIYLYSRERKFYINRHNVNANRNLAYYVVNKVFSVWKNSSWGWIYPSILRSRYCGIKGSIFCGALFATLYLFSIGIWSITLAVKYVQQPGFNIIYVSCDDYQTVINPNNEGKLCTVLINKDVNESNFLHNEGIIIVFFLSFLAVYTWLNTEIIKHRGFRSIETLDELLDTLTNGLVGSLGGRQNRRYSHWFKHSSVFYYVFDHTIAIGHLSSINPEKFNSYAKALYEFLRQPIEISFKGIVSDCNSLYEHYKHLISNNPESFEGMPENADVDSKDNEDANTAKILSKILEGHDFFIDYLNNNETISIQEEDLKIHCHGHYHEKKEECDRILDDNSQRNVYPAENSILVRDLFNNVVFHGASEPKEHIDGIKNSLKKSANDSPEKVSWEDSAKRQIICFEELGLTRFVVCNNFVLLFIAAKSEHFKRNVPAGFYSEDLVLIERFKTAFKKHWKGLD